MAPNLQQPNGFGDDYFAHTGVSQFKKLWIVVETPRNRSEINRNRFVPVCGLRPGHFGLDVVWFWGRIRSQIGDFPPDS
jgi:hypothetical protein